MKHLGTFAMICAVLLTLTGCEGTKEQLGLTRKVPDEFAVLKRAPLEMPPDYSLRPPEPGAPRPQEAEPEKQAEAVIFGGEKSSSVTADSAEAALLQQAGADAARPDIRRVVDQETAKIAPKEVPVAEKLLGIGSGKGDEPAASVVDAKAEAERLKKNAEEGKPVTEGETPSIEE
ncbi:MAG: DUF3035 domain-containing protein [Rhodospirillales bacterium]|nr:DUF3035 domain-containing protein [Rhodospirillales bacterium]MCB9996872.1 DUF3035 domain-containing protein [Rhodospirillales bacterium]